MTELFKPMLAVDADLNRLTFPLLASAKLDGVRATVRNGIVYSRSNKPIPNAHVQKMFGRHEYYDGELIVGDPRSKTCYRDTVSGVMSHDKEPAISFFAFDHIEAPRVPYTSRFGKLQTGKANNVIIHVQKLIHDDAELFGYEEAMLEAGYEGLILRGMGAPYKFGRSTAKEGYLLKLKRFADAEAEVIGFEERMKNNNEKTTNELGRGQRSSHQANKAGRGDLGALTLRLGSSIFNVGTGFSDEERAEIWQNQKKYMGRTVKFKHFTVGAKDAPRHPVFLGWRDGRDMS